MKNKINICLMATMTLLTAFLAGCSFSVGTNTGSSTTNTAKPGNTNTSAPANTGTAAKTDKPKDEKLAGEKRPDGKSTKAKDVPVPADWVYVYNDERGYGFSVPANSTGHSETIDGVDVFIGQTPEPGDIGIIVLAFKDAKLTKEDLLDRAEKVLNDLGQTVETGNLTGESKDYSIAEATMTGADGKKSKAKVLVATDVTDNYVMILGTDEANYAANAKIIDEIWGSFEMWSGGSSGEN